MVKPTILLFAGYNHSKEVWRTKFLTRLKALKCPIVNITVEWDKKINVLAFVKKLRANLFNKKYILIGHSLGYLFCWHLSRILPNVLCVLSLDGVYIGENGKYHNKLFKSLVKSKQNVKGDKYQIDKNLLHYTDQIPLKPIKHYVKTFCYRNVASEPNVLIPYIDEYNIANYHVRHYFATHHIHLYTPAIKDIILDIKTILKN